MSSKASGAMSGAATGAAIGSAVPVVGTAVGAAVGAVVGWFSSGDDGASDAAQADYELQMQMYANSANYADRGKLAGDTSFDKGMYYLEAMRDNPNLVTAARGTASFGSASMASASMAQAYDATAYDATAYKATAYQAELDKFLGAFAEAAATNELSMDTFNRRYGNLMDNMEQSIIDVSQERLSASGREQLMVDADTLKANFNQSIAKAGLTRSGITTEMEARMGMDVAREARAIDVGSYDQSLQLQSQGINALNSMTSIGENINTRAEMISQNKAHGLLSASLQDAALQTGVSQQNAAQQTSVSQQNAAQRTGVSQQNASQRTGVSQTNATNATNVSQTNATNATNVSMGNAANATNVSMGNASLSQSASAANAATLNNTNSAIAQSYMNYWNLNSGSANAFYSGVGAPNVSNVVNAENASSTANTSNWTNAAKAAGYVYKNYSNDNKTQAYDWSADNIENF